MGVEVLSNGSVIEIIETATEVVEVDQDLNVVGIPGGGNTGQILAKTGDGDYAVGWSTTKEILTADRTYYLRPDGNDANTGLSNTSGGAWLTLQHAWDWVAHNVDLNGYQVTFQLADGTYSGIFCGYGDIGINNGPVYIKGNLSDVNAVTIVADAGPYPPYDYAIAVYSMYSVSSIYLLNVTIHGPTPQVYGINAENGNFVCVGFDEDFNYYDTKFTGQFYSAISVWNTSSVILYGNNLYLSPTGTWTRFAAGSRSNLDIEPNNFIITSPLTVSDSLITAYVSCTVFFWYSSTSGSVIGKKYNLSQGSILVTLDVTVPGSVAGTTDTLISSLDSITNASLDSSNDLVRIWDASASSDKKITYAELLSGRVSGPASATDKAIVRYDGTTGKLVQNSGISITDNAELLYSGMGFISAINGRLYVNAAGVDNFSGASNYIESRNALGIKLGTNNADNFIFTDNLFEQRRGTSPQTIRIYNTYTDGSNYERGFIGWSSGDLVVGVTSAGTGTNRNMILRPGNGTLQIGDSVAGASIAIYGTGRQINFWNSGGGIRATISNPSGETGILDISNGLSAGCAIQLQEMTAPAASATNGVRIYAEDNGSGKTRLMAKFATGAAQQIAIEP